MSVQFLIIGFDESCSNKKQGASQTDGDSLQTQIALCELLKNKNHIPSQFKALCL